MMTMWEWNGKSKSDPFFLFSLLQSYSFFLTSHSASSYSLPLLIKMNGPYLRLQEQISFISSSWAEDMCEEPASQLQFSIGQRWKFKSDWKVRKGTGVRVSEWGRGNSKFPYVFNFQVISKPAKSICGPAHVLRRERGSDREKEEANYLVTADGRSGRTKSLWHIWKDWPEKK